ncbi:hypothetical protein P154DRAFT_560106 [Amniculicola lignicola CBS 123094]|uniref:Mid2 domain-containing protein n=1 Tax=Amniculicola lignicola CBS 123094 TaxID=1392246 RepID=A0A6A5WUA8_9PLEO|nr:hypothetical protein P154DRAFT_560106 [Amniculicola lignicola CBS 123094]
MRVNNSLAAFFALSSMLLGASASPMAKKRQDETTTSSAVSVATSGLVVGTLSDGTPTTFKVIVPQPTSKSSGSASTTGDASATATPTEQAESTSTPSTTGESIPESSALSCHAADARPFCTPSNQSTLYVGNSYYATWNPDFFPTNSTVQIKIQYMNDTLQEAWSSEKTQNAWGFVVFDTKSSWMQGYSMYNLTLYAVIFDASDPTTKAKSYKGPLITLENEPPNHYPAPPHNKLPNKEGLMIGLPVGLGFVVIVVIGLLVGMRKHRTIGLGNIMGRRNKGYGVGKSKRQRLALGKKGAIRLGDRESPSRDQYQRAPAHSRGDSLGSLVSDDEISPAPRGNQFRNEIDRQRTGR